MTTLSHERAGVARLHLSLARRLDDLLADPRARPGRTDPVLRERLARIYASIRVMRFLTERSLVGSVGRRRGGRQPGQAVLGALRPGAGRPGRRPHRARRARGGDRWAENLLAVRQASIAGGTTEINKNIVGEHVLGLPR